MSRVDGPGSLPKQKVGLKYQLAPPGEVEINPTNDNLVESPPEIISEQSTPAEPIAGNTQEKPKGLPVKQPQQPLGDSNSSYPGRRTRRVKKTKALVKIPRPRPVMTRRRNARESVKPISSITINFR